MAKAVTLALEGDTTALRICIDRLIPAMKAKDDVVELGSLEGVLSEQGQAILNATASGHITPDQAATIMQAIAAQARIVETSTRQLALELNFIPVVPPKSNRVDPWEYGRAMYKRRNEIERLSGA